MSNKRRDKKGRILRNGESQRVDGLYVFNYKDSTGKRRGTSDEVLCWNF